MTASWTSAFGRACGVLLDTIVRWLALSRINPNVLTFMGLVVNTWAHDPAVRRTSYALLAQEFGLS